jgi:hypothetical protein
MFVDCFKKPIVRVRIIFCAIEKGFNKAFDQSQRRAEFVGNVGDEFAARVFELLNARHVVEDENAAINTAGTTGKNGGGNFEGAGVFAGKFKFDTAKLPFLLDLFPKFEEFVGAKCFENGFAAKIAVEAEKFAQALVDGLNAAEAVEEKKAFRHAVKKGLALSFSAFVGEFFVIAQAVNFALLFFGFLFEDATMFSPTPLDKNGGQGCEDR